MSNQLSLPQLLIAFMATWRLASLFAFENGPKDIFWKVRQFLGVETMYKLNADGSSELSFDSDKMLGKMILCVWCNSFWIGVVISALFAASLEVASILLMPLALSTAAIFLDKVRRYA